MRLTPFTSMPDRDEIEALVREVGVAQLVTVGVDGAPAATLLPILWEGDRVLAHASASNPQFQDLPDGAPGLYVVTGPDAFVSPSWYPSKEKHGRAVPTWNYLAVHLAGPLTVHRDPAWIRGLLEKLTARHEGHRDVPWTMDQAPEHYLSGLLLGTVGLEMQVTRVEGKAKLSRNRTLPDRLGVIEGLRGEGTARAAAVAEEMARRESTPT